MAQFKVAFVAYPAAPHDLATTIAQAVKAVENSPKARITAWPQLDIFGAVIADEVRSGIETADVLICDVTKPNLNVYYEIGFSIGKRKSIAPIVNVSFANATQDIQKDGLFDIVGYRGYENSVGLAAILAELPDHILLELYGKPLNTAQPLYFLNAYRKTNFVASIAAAIKASKIHFRSFDPAEISRFSTVQIISDVSSSAGVIIPFLAPHIEDAERHNIRAAFLAGLTHGLGRRALLLKDGYSSSTDPADFRELVEAPAGESALISRVTDFATQTLIEAQTIRMPKRIRGETRLQKLTLGAIAAENEFRTLEDYFVRTFEFLRTVRGEVEIVAGRKGSGKTAIFFMVRDNFRREKGTVVVDLRPESHQLSLFRGELLKMLETGTFDHTLAAFWYFVVLSEVLLTIKRDLEFQARRSSVSSQEDLDSLEKTLQSLQITTSGDFTTRINRLADYVLREIQSQSKKGQQLRPEQLTNIVFKGGIAEAKTLVSRLTEKSPRIVLLFDNIDKGWATNGVEEFDVRLVRLLIEALEKVKRDLSAGGRSFVSVVFLRNDVYELLVDETPDRGKAAVVRIDWTDRAKLRQVIHLRLQSSVDEEADFSTLWSRYFVPNVGDMESFEYFVDHCLMRPRFLINIIEYAVANAINRGHEIVDAQDCIDAVRQHSNYLLNEFGYEIRDVSGLSSRLLHSLVGTTLYVTRTEIIERFKRAQVSEENLGKAFHLMLWYGVLGVISPSGAERYIYNFDYNMNRLEAEIDTQRDEPLFVVNRALHVSLQST
ncbi:P-loop ATPase, Sll1717 family [Bradyrhizobium sp. SZCCHNRI3042]|uniref:P-loop ATPase, Sll1717 family n=1 Tax=Bradyrhizobium sp. SZCCHNRI3042 TaxID=3057291 RepID=UPI0029169137|nr:hypothetical protein [Bradyrhizobium sp. SZCCHNRI3042]